MTSARERTLEHTLAHPLAARVLGAINPLASYGFSRFRHISLDNIWSIGMRPDKRPSKAWRSAAANERAQEDTLHYGRVAIKYGSRQIRQDGTSSFSHPRRIELGMKGRRVLAGLDADRGKLEDAP